MSNRSRGRQNLPTTAAEAAQQAREQADAYDSLFAPTELELEGGDTLSIPPHPNFGMLDDEATEAYEELLFERDTLYERTPDIIYPETRVKDPTTGKETGAVIPGETQQGQLKTPYRIKDDDGTSKLVKPPWNVKVVQAVLGEDYKKLRDGGRSCADVWRIWGKQGIEVAARNQFRQAIDAGVMGMASVPEADSE
jgi:hypothetical protein